MQTYVDYMKFSKKIIKYSSMEELQEWLQVIKHFQKQFQKHGKKEIQKIILKFRI